VSQAKAGCHVKMFIQHRIAD